MSNDGEIITYSADTYVEMSRELDQHLEKDTSNRLIEGWGEVFKWMDLCAAISAIKHAKTGKIVTAQVDDMKIQEPLLYGDMLTVFGQVNNAWNTSMEVEIRLIAENLLQSESVKRTICISYFTFVLVKEEGKTNKLPTFLPSNSQDEQKYFEAIERRQIRFNRRKLIHETSLFIKDADFIDNINDNDKDYNIKEMKESSVNSSVVVLPSNANPHGNTFGGQIMSWMEETARLVSKKHSRRKMYLTHIDDIRFIAPSKVGDWITLKAQVNRVFGTTIEVGVKVEARSFSGDSTIERHINSGYLTYSCEPIGESVEQIILPKVKPTNDRERKQYNEAIGRRRIRISRRIILKQDTKQVPEWNNIIARDLIYSNIKNILYASISSSVNWWEFSNKEGIKTCIFDSDEITMLKMEFTLVNLTMKDNIKAKHIFPFFRIKELRKQWDDILIDISVIEEIDENNDIAHLTFGPDNQHFCVLRSWRTPDNGFNCENQYILSCRSVNYSNTNQSDIDWGIINPSGFILYDTDEGIKVIYLLQTTGTALQSTIENAPLLAVARFQKLMLWFKNLTSIPQ